MIREKEALQPPLALSRGSSATPTSSSCFHSCKLSTFKSTPALPSSGKGSSSSHSPLKRPMAGTFYRSPAPGEPPFAKVGDKVHKWQVICIIEAMKLMNGIELQHVLEP